MKLRKELIDVASKNDIPVNQVIVVLGHIYLYEELDHLYDIFQPAELMEVTRVFCYFDHDNDKTFIKPEYLPLFEVPLWEQLIKKLSTDYDFTQDGPPNQVISKMYARSKDADQVLIRLSLKKVSLESMAKAISRAYRAYNSLPLERVITSQLETLLLFESPVEEKFTGLV